MIAHKSDYLYDKIDRTKLLNALIWLVEQPLYINEEIRICDEWLKSGTNSDISFIVEEEDQNTFCDNEFQNQSCLPENSEPIVDSLEYDSDSSEENIESDSDEDEPSNHISDETLLTQEGIMLAPGEGNTPVSIFSDNCEELCFPTIYAGHSFNENNPKNLSATELDKYKIRYFDRRFCKIPILLFLLRHKQISNLKQHLKTVLKIGKYNDKEITAGDIRDQKVIDSLLKNDDAFKVLANDRSSPQFWSKKMKDLMAMVRQLGEAFIL
jgi:hypothetical protein